MIAINNHNNKHHLTFGDVMRMNCIIEHDRMLYNGCDRQHLLFSDDQVDKLNLFNLVRMLGGLFSCRKQLPNDRWITITLFKFMRGS